MVKATMRPAVIHTGYHYHDLSTLKPDIEELFAGDRNGVCLPMPFVLLLHNLWMDQYMTMMRVCKYRVLLDAKVLKGGVHGKSD